MLLLLLFSSETHFANSGSKNCLLWMMKSSPAKKKGKFAKICCWKVNSTCTQQGNLGNWKNKQLIDNFLYMNCSVFCSVKMNLVVIARQGGAHGSVVIRLLVQAPLWSLVLRQVTLSTFVSVNPAELGYRAHAGSYPATYWCPIQGESTTLIHLAGKLGISNSPVGFYGSEKERDCLPIQRCW